MKRILYILILAHLATACQSHTVVEDSELADIFHDAFLVNAYTQNNQELKLDSLQLYSPIFEKYGYTTEDVRYTIGNFSKRKSARLSDVVEQAINRLERESDIYSSEVVILDTINAIAQRQSTKTIFTKDVARYRSDKDTEGVTIRIDSAEVGEYNIYFDYLIDSAKTRYDNYKYQSWLEKKLEIQKKPTRSQTSTTYLQKYSVNSFHREIEVKESGFDLVIKLIEPNKNVKSPNIKIKNIKLTFTPEAELAVEDLYKRELKINIFADEFFYKPESQDSLVVSTTPRQADK